MIKKANLACLIMFRIFVSPCSYLQLRYHVLFQLTATAKILLDARIVLKTGSGVGNCDGNCHHRKNHRTMVRKKTCGFNGIYNWFMMAKFIYIIPITVMYGNCDSIVSTGLLNQQTQLGSALYQWGDLKWTGRNTCHIFMYHNDV